MQVVDWDRSERGPQRRRSEETGKLLHCCCICGNVGVWNLNWNYYGSIKELDDGDPVAKFCNDLCQRQAGKNCENVSLEMKAAAHAKEMREPELVYREATDREKYNAARNQQRRQ